MTSLPFDSFVNMVLASALLTAVQSLRSNPLRILAKDGSQLLRH
jgi:hypothetical protein